MAETAENTGNFSEEWQNFPPNVVDILNDLLKQNGNSNFESSGEAYVLPLTNEERINQVSQALSLNLGMTLANRLQNPGVRNPIVLGNIQEVNYGDTHMILGFTRFKGVTNDQYIQERNKVVAGANRTLEIFGKPKLPPVKPR